MMRVMNVIKEVIDGMWRQPRPMRTSRHPRRRARLHASYLKDLAALAAGGWPVNSTELPVGEEDDLSHPNIGAC